MLQSIIFTSGKTAHGTGYLRPPLNVLDGPVSLSALYVNPTFGATRIGIQAEMQGAIVIAPDEMSFSISMRHPSVIAPYKCYEDTGIFECPRGQ